MASEEKGTNRWLVVLGALVIQVSLGAVYIWSVFQTPLKTAFPTWTEKQVTLPSQLVLAAFALAVIFGGRFQDKHGPRRIATIGGIVLGLGLVLARFTGNLEATPALLWLILTFSIVGGIGIGLAYVCPIATCVKWYPDKRGLISGLAVAGFGAGGFFFGPLATGLISSGRYSLLGVNLFALPVVGLFSTFMALGVIFLLAVVLGAQLLRNPSPGYCPIGWTPPKSAASATDKVDFTPSEMLRTPMFWLLWLTYFAGCTAGLQIIMKASPVWQSMSMAKLTPPVAEVDFKAIAAAGTMAVSILAIFNALGRILWGRVSDSFGRKNTLIAMFAICGAAMLAMDALRTYPLYLLGVCVVGLCFGGYLALYPAVTADFFGTKHYGVNYGWMFSAYGAGGLVGPYLAAWLMKVVGKVDYLATDTAGAAVTKQFEIGNYKAAFIVAGVACLGAAVTTLALKRPQDQRG